MIKLTTFGCDPEIFVENQQGEVCSAIGMFGGTKEKPRPIKSLGEGFAVQEDNVLVEFNIPPAKTGAEFAEYVQKTIEVLSRRANRRGLSFRKGSAFSLNPEYLQHPQALKFGCDPDFNAYSSMANPPPHAEDRCLRSAGGHIAFGIDTDFSHTGLKGWDKQTNHTKTAYATHVIQRLDFLLGVPAILLDDGLLRKQLYGKAGAYRIKPFGVEYRTLSNFWIFQPKLAEAMIENVRALDFGNIQFNQFAPNVLEFAINNNHKDFANWAIKNHPTYFGWVKEFL